MTLVVLLGFAVSGAAGAAWYFRPALAAAVQDTGRQINNSAPLPSDTPGGSPEPTTQPESSQAFTVLLLGSDNDAKFGGGPILTQSMILARVDPQSKHVTMLSIPRDLYVPLSTGGTDKIDKAYMYGSADAAVATVEQDFRVHIDHYAWIGLLGLVHLIDKVNGIDVVATNPVVDDNYPKDLTGGNPYDFQRVAVMPGPQHMDGLQALEYVRSRHGDLRGDFGRSQRQQQVLIALRAKAKVFGIADIPDIADAMSNDFNTDMSVTQVGQLLPLAGQVSLGDIQQVILWPPYTSSQTVGSQDVLIPNWNLIRPEVRKYFPAT